MFSIKQEIHKAQAVPSCTNEQILLKSMSSSAADKRKLVEEAQAFITREAKSILERDEFPAAGIKEQLRALAIEASYQYHAAVLAFTESYVNRDSASDAQVPSAKLPTPGASASFASAQTAAASSSSSSSSAMKDDELPELVMGFPKVEQTEDGPRVRMPDGLLLEGGRFTKDSKSARASDLPSNARLSVDRSDGDELSEEVRKLLISEAETARKTDEKEMLTHVVLRNKVSTPVAAKLIEEFRYAKLDNPTRPARPWKLHDSVVQYARTSGGDQKFKPGSDQRSVPTYFSYAEALRGGQIPSADQPYNYCSTRLINHKVHRSQMSPVLASEVYHGVWLSAFFLLALHRKCMAAGASHQVLEAKISLGLALTEIGGPGSDPRETLLNLISPAIECWLLQGRVRPVVSHCPLCTGRSYDSSSAPCSRCGSHSVLCTDVELTSDHEERVVRKLLELSRLAGALNSNLRHSDPDLYRFFLGMFRPTVEAFGVPRQPIGKYPRWDYVRTLRRFLNPNGAVQSSVIFTAPLRLDLLSTTNVQFTHFDMLLPSADAKSAMADDGRIKEYSTLCRQLTVYLQKEMAITGDCFAQKLFRSTYTASGPLPDAAIKAVFEYCYMLPERRWIGFADLFKEAKQTGSPMHFVDYFPETKGKTQSESELKIASKVLTMNKIAEAHNTEFYKKRGLKVSCERGKDGVTRPRVVDDKGKPVELDEDLLRVFGPTAGDQDQKQVNTRTFVKAARKRAV